MGVCQIEEREAGRSYPRTCPTCRIGNPCAKGLDHKGLQDRIAALEAQLAARTGGVKVKPLEWTTSFIGSVNTGTVKAITEVGDYYAEWNGAFFEIELNTWATLPGFEVREWIGKDGADGAESRAKAAAQADYEQRILSALSPAPEAQQEPVAYRVNAPEDEYYGVGPDRLQFHPLAQHDLDKGYRQTPLYYTRPAEQAVTQASSIDLLLAEARTEAEKAMRKFPQPNYVISKVAEEAGEVVKAAIHCAEGRETPANVIAEIRQAMAMLIRLYIEGDQVHGLPPLKAAMEAGRHD